MSDYQRFSRVEQSLHQIDDIEYDLDLGVELGCGPSDGAPYKFILYTDHVKWSHMMVEKDLHPELLRWYLIVNNFDFEVCDEGKSGDVGDPIDKRVVHHLSNHEPSYRRRLTS